MTKFITPFSFISFAQIDKTVFQEGANSRMLLHYNLPPNNSSPNVSSSSTTGPAP